MPAVGRWEWRTSYWKRRGGTLGVEDLLLEVEGLVLGVEDLLLEVEGLALGEEDSLSEAEGLALAVVLGPGLLPDTLSTAAAALTMPAPQALRSHSAIGVAVFCSMVTTSSAFRSGLRASISATVPDTCGVAWLVPIMMA